MRTLYDNAWMEAEASLTGQVWQRCVSASLPPGPRITSSEQRTREKAYDEGLRAVEREVKRAPRSRARSREEKQATHDRILHAFGRFSATALDLDPTAIDLLTHGFLPVGSSLAKWARRFDPKLSRADIIQACRNAWTACGMQPLFGERLGITPAILGYSLLYPYSDNYLDREDATRDAKLYFSRRFRARLRGESISAEDPREAAVWAMIELIEGQFPRSAYPQVFECLLAIHRAQEESLAQLNGTSLSEPKILCLSCHKGGTSVLADAALAHGWLTGDESRFGFAWGVLLQLGDDLQDVREDLARGSATLFTRAVLEGRKLDDLVRQLLTFSEYVGQMMDALPHGSPELKHLQRMSWRQLIVAAVANSHQYFTPAFLAEAEQRSPFRFAFLRARNQRMANRGGLYVLLFDAFLEASEGDDSALPQPMPLSGRSALQLAAKS
jgi:hypothetical protein